MSEPSISEQSQLLAPLLKRAGSIIESEIRGPSMGRTLEPGTRIRIRCGTGLDFLDGTVIAFLAGQRLVGHRLVGRTRDRRGQPLLLTRGDGTVVCDPPLDPQAVLGEVIEWLDGDTWRPLPTAPPHSLIGRGVAATILLLIRLALVLDDRLAARTATLLARVGRRLSPPMPSP